MLWTIYSFISNLLFGIRWPWYIVNVFESTPVGGLSAATCDYGAFSMLLSYLFPYVDGYMVSLQRRRSPSSPDLQFIMCFLVQSVEKPRCQHPIFFLQVKPAGVISTIDSRESVDEQMRDLFEVLVPDLPIPTLYGVSALGRRLCIYTYSKEGNQVHPPLIRSTEGDQVDDCAPATRWDTDVLSEEGAQKLTAVAAHVKKMLNDL